MFREVQAAYERIKKRVNHTPVFSSSTLDTMTKNKCYFKCENFQKVGAFKFRGALNAVLLLSKEEKKKGVIAHSSGNFAQALSLAAKIAGVKATIVMPSNAPKVKVRATKGYGSNVVMCGNNPGDREEMADQLIEKHGFTLVHPSNDLNVIYGNGTAAFELIEKTGELDYVLAPVGGGGFLSGTAIATLGLCKRAKVVAIEPKNADDAYHSLRDGQIYPSINPNTIADGLRTSLGNNTFRIIKEKVEKIITVTEEQILDAMEFLWTRMKLVVEPSGAVSLAGLLSGEIGVTDKKVGIMISGGNIDLTEFFQNLRTKIQ